MALTANQEHFARLVALEGYKQSDAYREAYECPHSSAATVNSEANTLMQHPQIAPMIESLKQTVQAQALVDHQEIVAHLKEIAFSKVKNVRASDKNVALDKLAKISGLYQQESQENRPINITHVTVITTHGKETREVSDTQVVDGEGIPIPDEDTQE